MFLATTGLLELWDTSDEVLALGPGCLPFNRKQLLSRLRLSVAPSPWEHHDAIAEAEQYCAGVIDSLVHELVPVLNQMHGLTQDERYWRIVVGPWLLYYVHAMYDRYVSLKHVFRAHPGLRAVGLRPTDFRAPADCWQFVMWAYNEAPDWYNLQLYSQILGCLKPGALVSQVTLPTYESDHLDKVGRHPGGVFKGCLRGASGCVLSLLARIVQPRVLLGRVNLSWWDYTRLVVRMMRPGWAIPGPGLISVSVRPRDEILRKRLANLAATDEFTSILVQTLPINFPRIYVEGYRPFREACLAAWPSTPAIMVSTEDWFFNEAFKVLSAEYQARGTRLVGGQHGAGYGISRVLPQEKFELSVTDCWISWGWQDIRAEKVRPLPRRHLLSLPANHFDTWSQLADILFIATSHARYPFRFESYPVGRFDEILSFRARFIAALPNFLRDRLIVRFSNVDYGWYQVDRLREEWPRLRTEAMRTPLRTRLAQVRVAVIEYPGTSCLEALAANVPAVLFWNSNRWVPRAEAQPFFAELHRAGVLWDSPDGAAKKVADVYENAWAWWYSPAVQGARQAFVDRYALGREDWLEHWVCMLEKEVALSCESRVV